MPIQQLQMRNFQKANLYIVDERRDGGAVGLVDAGFGSGYARLRWTLGDRRPAWVFLTHWHGDHVGWLPRLRADYAPAIYCTAETASYLRGERTWRDSHFWRAGGLWWIKPFWGLAFLCWPVPLVENVTVVEPGATLDFGGARWQVMDLPGHTLGHAGLYDPAGCALFSGDAVFRRSTGALARPALALSEDTARLIGTVQRVASMGLWTIYPGHFSCGPVRSV